MSSYKAAIQGPEHKRVPDDIAVNPTIIGHEFCGEIVEVGDKWKDRFKMGDKFSIQPALNQKHDPYAAPGYSFSLIGGDATYIIIPNTVIEHGCLLNYEGSAYFYGSLAEPISCIIGAFHANYHTVGGSYIHSMGIVQGGNMALLAGAGPMGMGAVDYAVHCSRKPGLLVVTDIDEERLARAESVYSVEEAKRNGVELKYVNISTLEKPEEYLINLTDGRGYDDVFVYAPVKSVVEQGDRILNKDGCLNFFAGPTNNEFRAEFNFYNVHYNSTHIVGTSGGNTDDMKESLLMMAEGLIDPSPMITHIGGLDSVINATLNLPKIPGGKKLIYTNISMELTAIEDFIKKAMEKEKDSSLFAGLAEITAKHHGLWSEEAEKYLLSNARNI